MGTQTTFADYMHLPKASQRKIPGFRAFYPATTWRPERFAPESGKSAVFIQSVEMDRHPAKQ
jgi:hypothetical protein